MRVFLFVGATFLSFWGILKPAEAAPPPQQIFKTRPVGAKSQPSPQLSARLYFDATSSMQGFVQRQSNSGFKARVQQLEQMITVGWPSSRIECWKFGARVEKVGGGNCYSQVDRNGFFGLGAGNNITRLDSVLGLPPQPNALNIMLTDLYQDDADLDVMFRAVRDQVFRRGLVIGIAALRSPFLGNVYDIGLYKVTRRWEGERPWYLLITGQEGDVEHLLEQMTLPPMQLPQERLLLLSTHLWNEPVSWDSTSLEPTRVAEDTRLIQVTGASVPYKVFRLQDTERSALRVRVPSHAARFRPALEPSKPGVLRVESNVRLLGSKGPEPTAPSATGAEVIRGDISLTWNIKSLLRTGEYAQEVVLKFDPDAIRFPSFVSEWNTPLTDIQSNEAKTGKAFDGSRTQNLNQFIVGLWRILVLQNGTDIGALYFYFRR